MWFGHIRSINRNVWITITRLYMYMYVTYDMSYKQNYFLFHTTQLNPVWPNRVYTCSCSHASRIFAGSPGEYYRMEIILLFPAIIMICVLLCCWSQRFGISLRAKHNYCNPNTCRKLFLWHACQLLSTSTTLPVRDVLLDQTSSSCWYLTNKANAGFFLRIRSAKRKVVPHGCL